MVFLLAFVLSLVGLSGAHIGRPKYEFQVSIVTRHATDHICTGTIIDSEWILTAARCVFANETYFVRTETPTKHQQTKKVKKVYKHPSYDGTLGSPYDIALLRLNNALKLEDHTRPANLPYRESNDFTPKGRGVVLGWDITKDPASSPSIGAASDVVEFEANEKCFNDIFAITNNHMCLHVTNPICTRDVGGPIAKFRFKDAGLVVVGIHTYRSAKCARTLEIGLLIAPFIDSFIVPTVGNAMKHK